MTKKIEIHPQVAKLMTAEEIRAKSEQIIKEHRENAYKNKISTSLEEIVGYNSELVTLNNKILNKINSLDDTLLLFHKAFNDGVSRTEDELKSNNALLLELITIIDSKDDKKLAQFIGGMSGTIGIELLISYLKMKLGLTV